MARYLVTGGLGFVGSHLASKLLEDPTSEVVVVDCRLNPVFPLDDLVRDIQGDRPGKLTVQVQEVADYVHQGSLDAIYHFASVVGPAAVLQHAGFITESIVRDTYTMIRLAMKHGVRLVNVSTSEVYGGGDHGLCEEDTPRVIRGPASARQEYAAGKLACEVAIFNLCTDRRLDAITVRPFNISGVRQSGQGGFVLPRFVGQAILGLPLTVFGDGLQVRAFSDVRDVAAGIHIAGRQGRAGEVYNVGNSKNRITIRKLAELVIDVTGSVSAIEHVDPRGIYGAGYRDAPDKFPNSKRLEVLGWAPRFSTRDTVARVFESLSIMPTDMLRRVSGLDPT